MAARMMTFVMVAVSIILFFDIINLQGLEVGGLEAIGDLYKLGSGEISASTFFNNLFGDTGSLFRLSAAAAIIAGLSGIIFNSENYIILGLIIGIFVGLTGVFVSIINYLGPIGASNVFAGYAWIQYTIYIFITLFSIGYIVTMIEFFRSNV